MRLARCLTVREDTEETCSGWLRFAPGAPTARCDECNGQVGYLVAKYVCAEPYPHGDKFCIKPLHRDQHGVLQDFHAGGHFYSTIEGDKQMSKMDARTVLETLRTVPKPNSGAHHASQGQP